MIYNLMTPFYGRKRFLRRQRPICVRTLVRRHQLVELFGLTGAIVMIWLSAQVGNHWSAVPAPKATSVESASADLIIGVPVGKKPAL